MSFEISSPLTDFRADHLMLITTIIPIHELDQRMSTDFLFD